MWNRLYKQLEFVLPEGYLPVTKPSPAALDRFEKKIGFPLPTRYREFMQVFGPGWLSGYFRVFDPKRIYERIVEVRKLGGYQVEGFGQTDLLCRLVSFGNSFGGDEFAWDPEDVLNIRTHDYAIWVFGRIDQTLLKLSGSFVNFVRDICLGQGCRKFGIRPDAGGWPQCFEPFVKPKRR